MYSNFATRDIDVYLLSKGDTIVSAGIAYKIDSVKPEPGHADYVFIFVNGDPKPWHKRLDDKLPIAYV